MSMAQVWLQRPGVGIGEAAPCAAVSAAAASAATFCRRPTPNLLLKIVSVILQMILMRFNDQCVAHSNDKLGGVYRFVEEIGRP